MFSIFKILPCIKFNCILINLIKLIFIKFIVKQTSKIYKTTKIFEAEKILRFYKTNIIFSHGLEFTNNLKTSVGAPILKIAKTF